MCKYKKNTRKTIIQANKCLKEEAYALSGANKAEVQKT